MNEACDAFVVVYWVNRLKLQYDSTLGVWRQHPTQMLKLKHTLRTVQLKLEKKTSINSHIGSNTCTNKVV